MICNQVLDDGSVIRCDITHDLAILKQYGTGPVVSIYGIDGGGTLHCSCGQSRLIGNYLPSLYVSLAIRCSVCNEITVTPQLSSGEVLPNGLDLIAGDREYHINSGLILTYNGKIFTSSGVAKSQEALFRPIVDDVRIPNFDTMISAVGPLYDQITDGHFLKHLHTVRRGMQSSRAPSNEYPLPWALEYMSKIIELSSYQMSIDVNLPVAAHLIAMFYDMIMRWKHHPLFKQFALGFRTSGQYYHNICQLLAATYLIKQGIRYTVDRLDHDKIGLAGILLVQNHTPLVNFNYSRVEITNIGTRFEFIRNSEFTGLIPMLSSASKTIIPSLH